MIVDCIKNCNKVDVTIESPSGYSYKRFMSVNYNARLHRTTGNFVVTTMLSIRRLFIRWTPRYSTDITRSYFKKNLTLKSI